VLHSNYLRIGHLRRLYSDVKSDDQEWTKTGYTERRDKGDYRWVPSTSGIYRLYQGDIVVYVGQTNNLRGRLEEHDRSTPYWGSYDYKSTRYVPTRERRQMERRAIARNYPTRNRQ